MQSESDGMPFDGVESSYREDVGVYVSENGHANH